MVPLVMEDIIMAGEDNNRMEELMDMLIITHTQDISLIYYRITLLLMKIRICIPSYTCYCSDCLLQILPLLDIYVLQ